MGEVVSGRDPHRSRAVFIWVARIYLAYHAFEARNYRATVARGLRAPWPDPCHRDYRGRAGDPPVEASTAPLGRRALAEEKGVPRVRLQDGTVHQAEVHWYEAHGIGRREMKIKFPLLD
jgi:hypothetical protein